MVSFFGHLESFARPNFYFDSIFLFNYFLDQIQITAPNCFFSSKNFLKETTKNTVDECSYECSQTNDCTHFTFNSVTKNCFMQQGEVSLRNLRKPPRLFRHVYDDAETSLNLTCGIVSDEEEKISNLESNCDFPGNDILNVKESSSFACAVKCLTLGCMCTHFTFNPNLKLNCFLKQGDISAHRLCVLSNEQVKCGTLSHSINLTDIIQPFKIITKIEPKKDGDWCACPCQVLKRVYVFYLYSNHLFKIQSGPKPMATQTRLST